MLQALADQVAKLEAGVAQTKQVLDAFKEAGLKVGAASSSPGHCRAHLAKLNGQHSGGEDSRLVLLFAPFQPWSWPTSRVNLLVCCDSSKPPPATTPCDNGAGCGCVWCTLQGCTEEQGWAALQQASDNIKAELATKVRAVSCVWLALPWVASASSDTATGIYGICCLRHQ